MGGASRLIMLLATPLPVLLHCHHRLTLLRLACHSVSLLTPLSHSPRRFTSRPQLASLRASHQIHTQSNSNLPDDHFGFAASPPVSSHPWPEWSKFIDSLAKSGYHGTESIGAEDEFVACEELSEDFVRAASACLAFARSRSDLLGSLSRRDIEFLVENGTPFLFKTALDIARRMRAFLVIGEGNVLQSDQAHTIDLMKYLLSYATNTDVSSERESIYRGELVESTVRNLLSELASLNHGFQSSEPSSSVQYNFPRGYEQTTRPLGPKIEMKRGDWICPRCNFLNFARNNKCLECEEARPKRQLAGGEWECPQCDFFNYGRNTVCLRCDCKRPGRSTFETAKPSSGLGYGNARNADKSDIDSRLAANEEKAQRWFSKISQMDSTSDISSAATDEDFPEIMPLRKGVNRFVVSTRKTPLERRLASSQYQRNLGNNGSLEADNFQSKGANTRISRTLDEILGNASAIPDSDKNVADGQNTRTQASPPISNSASDSFVSLPNDMFTKSPQNSKMEDSVQIVSKSTEFSSSKSNEQVHVSTSTDSKESVESLQSAEMPLDLAASQDKEKQEAEKSERWFQKLAELHDVEDFSAISDEDFPEIMPTRKGENRFVVSKKKDRSLTSPMYKRRMAMEQGDSTNFVPFVPFPPDYFAKKDNQQPNEADSNINGTGGTSSSLPLEKSGDNSLNRSGVSDVNRLQTVENQQISTGEMNLKSSGEASRTGTSWGSPPITGNATQNALNSQSTDGETRSNEHSGKDSTVEGTKSSGFSSKQPENENARSGWGGKSLEGSAVQEPDPLDMSEEAKAQRFFRRAAQIKDISELSQIPDEDFPSIMPMRKGVNRFVVSKRKTPMERRLTSPQYRRNLPVVRSDLDPVKKENENS